MPRRREDVIGKRYGRLTIVADAPSRRPHRGKPRRRVWCLCDCGVKKDLALDGVSRGTVVSCGCYHREVLKANRGPSHASWLSDDQIGYDSAHYRVRRARGPAKAHQCAFDGCEKRASAWAYRHGSPNERSAMIVDPRKGNEAAKTVYFTTNPDDYDPLCHGHHVSRDRLEGLARRAQMTEQYIQTIFNIGRLVGQIGR